MQVMDMDVGSDAAMPVRAHAECAGWFRCDARESASGSGQRGEATSARSGKGQSEAAIGIERYVFHRQECAG